MQSVNIITSYPTVAPSDASLDGKTVARAIGCTVVDVGLVVTASDTFTLLGYDQKSAKWYPISDMAPDHTYYSGHYIARFSPGTGFTHFGVFRKIGSSTPTYCGINVSAQRG